MTEEQQAILQRYRRVCALCDSPEANEATVARSRRAAMEQKYPWVKSAAEPPPRTGGAGASVPGSIETVFNWLNTFARETQAAQASPNARLLGRSLVQPRLITAPDGGLQLVVDIPQATIHMLEARTGPDRTALALGIQDRVQAALQHVLGE